MNLLNNKNQCLTPLGNATLSEIVHVLRNTSNYMYNEETLVVY